MANKQIDPNVLENMRLPNPRAFKKLKRAQLKRVYRELQKLNCGSIEMPIDDDGVIKLLHVVNEWNRQCSVKEWGR